MRGAEALLGLLVLLVPASACLVTIDRSRIGATASADGGPPAHDGGVVVPSDAGSGFCGSHTTALFCDDFESAPPFSRWDGELNEGGGVLDVDRSRGPGSSRALVASVESGTGNLQASLRKNGVIPFARSSTTTLDVFDELAGADFLQIEFGSYLVRLSFEPLRLSTVDGNTTNNITYSPLKTGLKSSQWNTLAVRIVPPAAGTAGSGSIEVSVNGFSDTTISFDAEAARLMNGATSGNLLIGALQSFSTKPVSIRVLVDNVVVQAP